MIHAWRMKNPLAILLAVVLLLVAALPAAAAETTKQVEVRVKVGSSSMSVNGEKVKIQPPFNSGKIAMVPLSVFTNAKGFGATVKPVNKNIQLAYLKHKVTLTKNSKAATFDGKKATLPAAPVDKSGVTMVPVEAIAKALGIKLTTDAKTKELVLKGTGAAPAAAASGNSIDSDAGKSKIGDSYYKWSMNYPTGLIQDTQSENGDSIVFRDVKKEYYLGIFVTEATEPLSVNETRNRLYEYLKRDETIVDKRTVNNPDGTSSYEKIVTKDKSGFFYEQRGIQANNQLYVVVFGKKVSSIADLSKETGILDSFKTTFNIFDKTLKDLSKIIGGFKAMSYEDYGLTLQLPKDWALDKEVSYPYYSYKESYLWFDVTSTVAGETLDAWIDRKMKRFTDAFSPQYGKIVERLDVTWNGIPAKAVKISYSYDTETWWEEYEVFAVNGSYRYYTEFGYTDELKYNKGITFEQLMKTMKVDFKAVENNFGEIPDEYDTMDRVATSVKTNNTYEYSVTIPDHWRIQSEQNKPDRFEFTFGGGGFAVSVHENEYDVQGAIRVIDSNLRDNAQKDSKFKVIESTPTTFAGQPAQKFVYENANVSDENTPYRVISYVFGYRGDLYFVEGSYFLANGSEFVIKQLEAALASFKFNS